MKAVVMAGGEGSRLRPLTIGRPKPMVPMVSKPVMAHILDLLKRQGITEVVITLHFMPEVDPELLWRRSKPGHEIHYAIEETPLGTAGSVKNAQEFLDEPFHHHQRRRRDRHQPAGGHRLSPGKRGRCDPDPLPRAQSPGIRRDHHRRRGQDHPVPGKAVVGRGHLGHGEHAASMSSTRRCWTSSRRACPPTGARTFSPSCWSRAAPVRLCGRAATGPTWATSREYMRASGDVLHHRVQTEGTGQTHRRRRLGRRGRRDCARCPALRAHLPGRRGQDQGRRHHPRPVGHPRLYHRRQPGPHRPQHHLAQLLHRRRGRSPRGHHRPAVHHQEQGGAL